MRKTEKQKQTREFRYDSENFARIAKISLGLRKFRNHSENFASREKLSLCENFARLAKILNFAISVEFR